MINAPLSPKGFWSGQSAVGTKRLIVYIFAADLVPQLQVIYKLPVRLPLQA
jgi:hypothetical protein